MSKTVVIRIKKEAFEELKMLCMLHDKNMPEMASICVMSYQELCAKPKEIKKLRQQIYRYKYDSHEKGS